MTPSNHGKIWSREDAIAVAKAYREGHTIPHLAAAYGRTDVSIRCKLSAFFADMYGDLPDRFLPHRVFLREPSIFAEASQKPQQPTPPAKETIMQLKIENRTYVNDRNATSLSLDAMFTLITEAEIEMERLNQIKHKPKALEQRIAELEEGIGKLVELCDARLSK